MCKKRYMQTIITQSVQYKNKLKALHLITHVNIETYPLICNLGAATINLLGRKWR